MGSRRVHPSKALAFLALLATAYAASLLPSVGGFASILTAGLGVIAILTLRAAHKGSASERVVLATSPLLAGVCLVLASLWGPVPFWPYGHEDPRLGAFVGGAFVFICVGLWRRIIVARWLAMALSCGGILTSTLNLLTNPSFPYPYTWPLAVHLAGGLMVLANLEAPSVREAFEERASALWVSPDPMLRALRWAVTFHFVAVPMLLVYAWLQKVYPPTAAWAPYLAALLSVSALAAASERVMGAVGLIVGGIALLALSAITVVGAYGTSNFHGWVSLYYLLFWAPAGLASLYAGFRLAGPLARLLSSERAH